MRLVRGQLSNNIAGHPVELHAGGKTTTVKTDENGRAEFKGLSGSTVKFSAEVDGKDAQADAVSVSTTVPFLDHPDWFVALTKDYQPYVQKCPTR